MAAARDRAAARRGARGLRTRANNADSIVWWLYRHCGHRYLTVRDLSRSVADLGRATQLVEGHPDQIEPDGQPNASNTSIGTLHSSIAYHLGLAYYLQGDFARAVPVYAAAVLVPIRTTMHVIESATYHRLLLLYNTELPVDSVLAVAPDGGMSVTDATAASGIGNWHLYNGRAADADRVFRRILAGGQVGRIRLYRG